MKKGNGWWKGGERSSEGLCGLLDRGTSVEGKLTFDGTLQINGDYRGEIYSDGTLIVGPDAHIAARIVVGTLIIDGTVEGAVEAKTKIEVRPNGRLVANVIAKGLVIHDGGLFEGTSQSSAADGLTADRVHDLETPLANGGERQIVN